MNETDFIRQQLASERAHLREILHSLRQTPGADRAAHPMALYIDWAGRRLITQVQAHHTALRGADTLGPAMQTQLAAAVAAAREAQTAAASALPRRAELLLAVLDAWSEPLDAAACTSLRVPHWRQAAHLTADIILEERQLYAAAHGAAAR
ncbi:MAG TPA: hypothetical protein VGV09_04560 [Steroidobacteraceae bacterium]|nr:hypothetical protein [Steroidobacteraceae bacterium]